MFLVIDVPKNQCKVCDLGGSDMFRLIHQNFICSIAHFLKYFWFLNSARNSARTSDNRLRPHGRKRRYRH